MSEPTMTEQEKQAAAEFEQRVGVVVKAASDRLIEHGVHPAEAPALAEQIISDHIAGEIEINKQAEKAAAEAAKANGTGKGKTAAAPTKRPWHTA